MIKFCNGLRKSSKCRPCLHPKIIRRPDGFFLFITLTSTCKSRLLTYQMVIINFELLAPLGSLFVFAILSVTSAEASSGDRTFLGSAMLGIRMHCSDFYFGIFKWLLWKLKEDYLLGRVFGKARRLHVLVESESCAWEKLQVPEIQISILTETLQKYSALPILAVTTHNYLSSVYVSGDRVTLTGCLRGSNCAGRHFHVNGWPDIINPSGAGYAYASQTLELERASQFNAPVALVWIEDTEEETDRRCQERMWNDKAGPTLPWELSNVQEKSRMPATAKPQSRRDQLARASSSTQPKVLE